MKTMALFIAVLSSLVFSVGITFANDAAPTPSAKSGERANSAIAARQPSVTKESPSQANDKLKTIQPRNAMSAAPSTKSALPVNAGQQRGLAIVGGAATGTARKSGALNGTEVRHSP